MTAGTFITIQSANKRALQLRAIASGAVTKTLLHVKSATGLSATRGADGHILAALSRGCSSTLERIDPRTGRTTTLRTVHNSVTAIALSPDGTRIAYLTHPHCTVDYCPGVCAGPAAFNPNVLVVLNLSTGHSTRTSTGQTASGTPGYPLGNPTWSPNGKRIASEYKDQVVIFDAADLKFHDAHRVSNPAGCSYFAPAWTATGIVAAEGCGRDPELSPSKLVRIDAHGVASAQWALPKCIDGLATSTDPARQRVLIQTDIGYTTAACGQHRATKISRLTNSGLHTVLRLPGQRVKLELQ